jgi:hypothetical protein
VQIILTIIFRQGYLSLNLKPAVKETDLYFNRPFFLIAAERVLIEYLLVKIPDSSASLLMFL